MFGKDFNERDLKQLQARYDAAQKAYEANQTREGFLNLKALARMVGLAKEDLGKS
jgi:hypothetical protein